MSTPTSLKRYLLAWIITPIAVFVAIDTVSLYRQALQPLNTAYDRSLLASARSIGELLALEGDHLKVSLPYVALEIFEADNASRMYYRINGFHGEYLSGYEDLPVFRGKIPQQSSYAALVHFYDTEFRGEPVRMAALYQPVASATARGMALVQVAETLEIRQVLARRILLDTLWRQAMLIAVVALVTWLVVGRALRPLEALRQQLQRRHAQDLSPIQVPNAPLELQPMVEAITDLMQRLQRLVGHQLRFVRDASHQLRTPLAVLKTQLQLGLRGDAPADDVMRDMNLTVNRATQVANQMLALAKVEQVHSQGAKGWSNLTEVARGVALDLSPLIGDKGLDFELDAVDAQVRGHEWMLRELIRNLLHNAVRASPPRATAGVRIAAAPEGVRLTIWDSGPGIDQHRREHLFEPFSTGDPIGGAGLGLTICREICQALGARIELNNRLSDGQVAGLDAVVTFPRPEGVPGTATRDRRT